MTQIQIETCYWIAIVLVASAVTAFVIGIMVATFRHFMQDK